jgi:hypothetical protein
MGRGGFGGSSDRVRGVKEKARAANKTLEATRLRTASILGSNSSSTEGRRSVSAVKLIITDGNILDLLSSCVLYTLS